MPRSPRKRFSPVVAFPLGLGDLKRSPTGHDTSTMRFSVATLIGALTIVAVCFSIWRRDPVLALVSIAAMASIWRVTKLARSEKITVIRAVLNGGLTALVAIVAVAFVPLLVYVGYQLLAGTWSTNYPDTPAFRVLAGFVVLYGGGAIIVGAVAGLATHAAMAMLVILPHGKLTESGILGEPKDEPENSKTS